MTDQKLKEERKRIRRFAALDIEYIPPKHERGDPVQFQRSRVTSYTWVEMD